MSTSNVPYKYRDARVMAFSMSAVVDVIQSVLLRCAGCAKGSRREREAIGEAIGHLERAGALLRDVFGPRR